MRVCPPLYGGIYQSSDKRCTGRRVLENVEFTKASKGFLKSATYWQIQHWVGNDHDDDSSEKIGHIVRFVQSKL